MFKDLKLENFRSHHKKTFEFTTGVNLIIGKNGSGKTNLLEALFILATGKSFRGRDQTLIEHNKDWSRAEAVYNKQTRVVKVQDIPELETQNKTFEIDNKEYKRFPYTASVAVCLFEPGHLQALYNGPDQRRALLDQLLTQASAHYTKALAGYKRALTQRNNLLKTERSVSDDEMFIWDVRLSEFGQIIVNERQAFVDKINENISIKYNEIAGNKHTVKIVYKTGSPPDSYGSWLLAKLQKTTQRDKLIGFTTNGPHRDDLVFYLDGELASQTASRGEIRSLMLAYKLLELDYLESHFEHKPLIMFDDVFSELDETRQNKLLETIKNHQAFITTTHKPKTTEYTIEL